MSAPRHGPPRPARPARAAVVAAVIAITVVALVLRLWDLPGRWGSDAQYYVATALGQHDPTGGSNRDFRWMVVAAIRSGLWIGGDEPGAATLPATLLTTAAVPLVWLLARRRLGATTALLPAALVAFLPVVTREAIQPGADGALTAFGALLLLAADRADAAADDPPRAVALWALAGVVAGVGIVWKEIFLLTVAPLAAFAAVATWRRRMPWRAAVAFAIAVAVLVAADQFVSSEAFAAAGRAQMVDARMTAAFADRTTASRLALGPLPSLATDTFHWGGFFLVAAAPLAVALTSRSVLASRTAVVGAGGIFALWFLPVGLRHYVVLPDDQPRYLLGFLPALVQLPLLAVDGDPPAAWRRAFAAVVAAAGAWIALPHAGTAAAALCAAALVLRPPDDRARSAAGIGALLVLCAATPDPGGALDVLQAAAAAAVFVACHADLRATVRAVALCAACAVGVVAVRTVGAREIAAWNEMWTACVAARAAPAVYATPGCARLVGAALAADGRAPSEWSDADSSDGLLPARVTPGAALVRWRGAAPLRPGPAPFGVRRLALVEVVEVNVR